ncbi:hypothetical protein CLV98_10429 [Dyadobacter jejuensis]|uniref:GAF domain-containing protein n=1 Tax=Dyadobacter jejuensis TaxID=1082580 RepID=A0A316AL01_9BACT|nr:GAF domain-containing protein [Dyadobacter jejuensis]PWJ58172.1 hypothetical protein CLV98_10429 [Dyadobacter jejuensis]
MKTHILHIADQKNIPSTSLHLNSTISFTKIIQEIRKRVNPQGAADMDPLMMRLKQLTDEPRFVQPMTLEETGEFPLQMAHIYRMLVPGLAREEDNLIAFCPPLEPTVFYGTDAFYDLMMDKSFERLNCQVIEDCSTLSKDYVRLVYSVILEKLYGFPPIPQALQTISIIDECTGLPRYYRVNIDNSYVDVSPIGELPLFNLERLRKGWQEKLDPSVILEVLPLSLFTFDGFSILSLTDITIDYAQEELKNILINRDRGNAEAQYHQITGSLRTLVGSPHIEFDLIPLIRVNNRLIINPSTIRTSPIHHRLVEAGYPENKLQELGEEYFDHPELLFMPTMQVDDSSPEYLQIFKSVGVNSFALMPVYCSRELVGILNIYANKDGEVNEAVMAKLDLIMPLAEQILQKDILAFNRRLDEVIKDEFTSLQDSVEWKFKEVAWDFLKHEGEPQEPGKKRLQKINFKDVFPLYGAIDIRNSTLERGDALQADLEIQFAALINTLTLIGKRAGFGLAETMLYNARNFIEKIRNNRSDSDEVQLQYFLESELHPFLRHFESKGQADQPQDEIAIAIADYFARIDEQKGAAFANRRALEASMGMVNTAINQYLDLVKIEVQQTYPIYFEKFRTDGVEYDIYIGQSIAPERPYSPLYLKNIRFWQLSSMAAIGKMTHHLVPSMEKPLHTTQLIFIHSGSIDIAFRDDERRFDVEGGYNIRYQVIKKRIDKVHILQTGERLTQPGKIALVYFNEDILKEYLAYISTLQNQNILLNDLELLELEELQGVNGLKALRVGINFEQ